MSSENNVFWNWRSRKKQTNIKFAIYEENLIDLTTKSIEMFCNGYTTYRDNTIDWEIYKISFCYFWKPLPPNVILLSNRRLLTQLKCRAEIPLQTTLPSTSVSELDREYRAAKLTHISHHYERSAESSWLQTRA